MLAVNAETDKQEDRSDFSSDEDDDNEDVGYSYAPLGDSEEEASSDYYSAIPSGDVGDDEQLPEPTEENIDALLNDLRNVDISQMDIRMLTEGILGFLTMSQREARASGTTGSLPVDGAEANNANVASQVRASIADETRSEETQDETLNEKLSLTKEGKLTIGDDVQLSPDESSAIAAAMCGWAPPVAHVPDYLKNMNDKELLSTLFKDA